MAVNIAVDSKCQYVAVCNAAETLLVDSAIAGKFLPQVKAALEAKGIELRGCERTASIIDVKPATEEDWSTEYLDYILSIKLVDGLDEAIDHINRYGSKHTERLSQRKRPSGSWPGRFGQRLLELQHALQRRFPLWTRRRSRHQYEQDPRPRPRRPRRPGHL
jgi:hypothetical protein